MFKFFKTKKGFTLVELMIVVVIMAILVVVAVPIYNSVTKNAREKTCLDNQRQILGGITNQFSMRNISGTGGPVIIEFASGVNDGDAPTITEKQGSLSDFSGGVITLETISSSFQTVPVCPEKPNKLTATISIGSTDSIKVTVKCDNSEHDLGAN